jgi:hypothetical protein
VLGGGVQDFLPDTKDGTRKDGRDLLSEIRRKGFDVARTKAELEAIPGWRRPKLFGAFASSELAYADQMEARRDQPSLPDMVRRAIELLQYNRGGYLLVVNAHLMRTAAEQNDGEHTLAATAELDRAVAVALRYAGDKSTIIVCGNVGLGGLHLNGSPFRADRGIAVLGLNSAGDPWFSWASGPNGTKSYGTAKLAAQSNLRRNQRRFMLQPRLRPSKMSSHSELARALIPSTARSTTPPSSQSFAICSREFRDSNTLVVRFDPPP